MAKLSNSNSNKIQKMTLGKLQDVTRREKRQRIQSQFLSLREFVGKEVSRISFVKIELRSSGSIDSVPYPYNGLH